MCSRCTKTSRIQACGYYGQRRWQRIDSGGSRRSYLPVLKLDARLLYNCILPPIHQIKYIHVKITPRLPRYTSTPPNPPNSKPADSPPIRISPFDSKPRDINHMRTLCLVNLCLISLTFLALLCPAGAGVAAAPAGTVTTTVRYCVCVSVDLAVAGSSSGTGSPVHVGVVAGASGTTGPPEGWTMFCAGVGVAVERGAVVFCAGTAETVVRAVLGVSPGCWASARGHWKPGMPFAPGVGAAIWVLRVREGLGRGRF